MKKRKTKKNNHSNWFSKYWIKHNPKDPTKISKLPIPRDLIDTPKNKRSDYQN